MQPFWNNKKILNLNESFHGVTGSTCTSNVWQLPLCCTILIGILKHTLPINDSEWGGGVFMRDMRDKMAFNWQEFSFINLWRPG